MISSLFHTIVYTPLYNALVYLVGFVPGHDVGIAIIILTIVVRILLFPLSRKAIKTQMALKELTPEIESIKERFKDDKQGEAAAIMQLYKEKQINPFSSFGILLLQLPILIGLYFVFARGGFPAVDQTVLYSFVSVPTHIQMFFLGVWNMAINHNIFLASAAAITQALYTRLSMGPQGQKTATEASLSNDMARSFDLQARYGLPLIIGFVGYTFVAAAALYYTVSNVAMIIQELLSGRKFN